MKTFGINISDLQEMNHQEMIETEGGSLIGWGIAVGVIYLLTSCNVEVRYQNGDKSQQGKGSSAAADRANGGK